MSRWLEVGVVAACALGLTATSFGSSAGRSTTCREDVFFSDEQPAWSADGSRIAFVRTHAGGGKRVLVVAQDGTGERPLTACVGGAGFPAELQWSPKGNELVYAALGTIRLVRADGGGITILARGREADWSPDGNAIAFTRLGSVYVIGRDRGGLRRLAAGESPDWSPDGTRLLFERNGIRVIRADGSGERRIASGSNPAWSPRGDVIAAVEYPFGSPAIGPPSRLVVIRRDGSGRRVLARTGSEGEIRARWSRDGALVGFDVGWFSVFRLQGSGPARMEVNGPHGEWAPDGTRVAVAQHRPCGAIGIAVLGSPIPRPITNQCLIAGTPRGETIAGTPRADHIEGRGGADRIGGLGGTDLLLGGTGRDRIAGGASDDQGAGEAGDDLLLGGTGSDRLGSAPGDERFEEGGHDRLEGEAGDDQLGGGGGRDLLRGGAGRDVLEGGDGADLVAGGPGNDILNGSKADADLGDLARDRIVCGGGYDRVRADRLDVVARDCEEVRVEGRLVRRRR